MSWICCTSCCTTHRTTNLQQINSTTYPRSGVWAYSPVLLKNSSKSLAHRQTFNVALCMRVSVRALTSCRVCFDELIISLSHRAASVTGTVHDVTDRAIVECFLYGGSHGVSPCVKIFFFFFFFFFFFEFSASVIGLPLTRRGSC